MASSFLPASLRPSLAGMPVAILSVPMESKYQCQQCQGVLRKPFQAQCGHRFCFHCLKQFTSSGPKPCEACRLETIFEEPLSILNIQNAFPDNAARREIESLPATCANEGCHWKGIIKDYEGQHEGHCQYEHVPCNACHVLVLRSEQERHRERECVERILNCKYCKATFSFKEIKAHDEICQKFPMQCKDCGKKKISREKLPDHSKSCGKSKVTCPFVVLGCTAVIENEKLSEHEQASSMEHLRLVLHELCQLKQRAEEDSGLGLYCGPQELVNQDTSLAHKVTALENVVCVLSREVERCALKLEAASRQHRIDQEKIENLASTVRKMERSLSRQELQLAEAELKLQKLKFATYDGIFIWKITDFSRRRQEALSGRTPAIFSPAFFTSQYGYKMCLRLYLNGDGTGRGTHLSLFFVIMKGNGDALLKWPFIQKVTLMLLDLNNREHVIDAFRPDTTSCSFQRPISEMNIASGCPLFCPLAKLAGKNSYLRDDTIFIKAIVDLTGL